MVELHRGGLTPRQVDADGLPGHGPAIFHACEADRACRHVEVLRQDRDELDVLHILLLHPDVHVLAFATGLVERQFLDQEILRSFLDASAERTGRQQSAGRQRRWQRRQHQWVRVRW